MIAARKIRKKICTKSIETTTRKMIRVIDQSFHACHVYSTPLRRFNSYVYTAMTKRQGFVGFLASEVIRRSKLYSV